MARQLKNSTVALTEGFISSIREHFTSIDKRLDNIETSQKEFAEKDQEQYNEISKHMVLASEQLNKLDNIDEHLMGTPEKPGLIIRLDRAERTLENLRKLTWTCVGAIVMILGKYILSVL